MSRSTSVSRIKREIKEIVQDDSELYFAEPLEDNMFEWHFTISGAKDTEFEGGLYHGKIILPSEYPFKPPSILFLTANGRFETHTRICLSVTGYHPEQWQASWGIRTVLLGMISHFAVADKGSIGALDYPKEERKRLAQQSVRYRCPQCCVSNWDSMHLNRPAHYKSVPPSTHDPSAREERLPPLSDAANYRRSSSNAAQSAHTRFVLVMSIVGLLCGVFLASSFKALDFTRPISHFDSALIICLTVALFYVLARATNK